MLAEPPSAPAPSAPCAAPMGVAPAPAMGFGGPPPAFAAPAPGASARHVQMAPPRATPMGLGAGGRMEQAIYRDPYGVRAWDEASAARCFVHLVTPQDFARITGEPVLPSPVDAHAYASAGLPWFELDDQHVPSIEGSDVLGKVKTVQTLVP